MATAPQPTQDGYEQLSLSCVQPGHRLFTAADLAAMPLQLPSGSVSFELHHGRLVPMSPPGALHANLQNRIGSALAIQGEEKGYGKAYTEVGIVLARHPDHIVGADAAFVTNDSLPARESAEGYLETIPELIVEIRSKNDTEAEIGEKVAGYLQADATLVWVLDPDRKSIKEHRPNRQPVTLATSAMLQCDDIIPGFRLSIAELFRE